MVILDADHPDIEDFIWCKAIEERKARVLRDAGFDMDLDGKDSISLQYQNANNSVRVTDEFMQAVIDGRDWALMARTGDGRTVRTVPARDLFRQISQAAWECADPGMQFDTTINRVAHGPQHGPDQRLQPLLPRLGLRAHRQGTDRLLRAVRPGQPRRAVRRSTPTTRPIRPATRPSRCTVDLS